MGRNYWKHNILQYTIQNTIDLTNQTTSHNQEAEVVAVSHDCNAPTEDHDYGTYFE
jgi:hypothetical protein